MFRRLVFAVGLVAVVVLAAAAAIAAVFLAWRMPAERREEQTFSEKVRMDDGPHVTWIDGRTVRVAEVRFDRGRRVFTAGDRTLACQDAIPVVASIDPNARVDCSPPPAIAPPADVTAPLVAAVSDVHGHYRNFAALLRGAGIVDERLDWSFGSNHLVVAGDVVDKGPEITRSLWLVKKLEQQALQAGGRLHFLLGNHEFLALTGASRINDRKYIDLTGSLGIPYAQLFAPATELGRWIRRHGVGVRVNDTLFVHGGIPASLLDGDVSLEEINRVAMATLAAEGLRAWTPRERRVAEAVWGRDGVTSSRSYFDRSVPVGFWRALRGDLRENRSAKPLLARALEHFQCERIVVGHTETRRIVSLFGGRLVGICLRLPAFDVVGAGAPPELLLIDGRRLFRVTADGRRIAL
jgi:hypothetical protein